MSEIIQENCSKPLEKSTWGETSGHRTTCPTLNSPEDNAPDSETNSPHVVILHNVLKYACKSINILKLYSPQLDINLADRFELTSDYLFPGLSFVRGFF